MSSESNKVVSANSYVPPHLRRKKDGPRDESSQSMSNAPSFPSMNKFNNDGNNIRASQPRARTNRMNEGGGAAIMSKFGTPSQAPDGAWIIPGRPKSYVNERRIFGEPNVDGAGGTVYRDVNVFDGIPITLDGKDKNKFREMRLFVGGNEDDNNEEQNYLHNLVLENIGRVGYDRPSPVQMWSIPIMASGRDLMACAQTGSGKTAGFLCPIISGMLKSGPIPPPTQTVKKSFNFSPPEYPVALCMSPTRELASQIYDEAQKFTYKTGVRSVVVYGGTPIVGQMKEIRKGMDICIATPGRLSDLVDRGCVGLETVKYFVLDEADRMLDMGFAPQIESIVHNTGMPDKDERQTVMFSATFPKSIQNMARSYMKDYLYLTIGRVGSTNDCIRQDIIQVRESDKPDKLMELLSSVDGLTLIFVDTKRRCDTIADFLNMNDIGCVSIHGDRTQSEREQALFLFKNGRASVMVATDVASRGLDINNVAHVINVDVPANIDDYVHRIGRTGRAGNKGIASSLITEKNKGMVGDLIKNLNESKQEVPKFLLEMVRGSHGGMGRRGGFYGGGGGMGNRHRGGNRW